MKLTVYYLYNIDYNVPFKNIKTEENNICEISIA